MRKISWGISPLLCLLMAGAATAQTYAPALPTLPPLPLPATQVWSKPSYAPGEAAYYLLRLTNPAPAQVPTGVTITAAPSLTWTEGRGWTYAAPCAAVTVAEVTVNPPVAVGPITLSFPAGLRPTALPPTAANPYTFAPGPGGGWVVTIPAFTVPAAAGEMRVIEFTVAPAPPVAAPVVVKVG